MGTSSFRAVDRKRLVKNQSQDVELGAYYNETSLIKKTFNVKTYVMKK